MNRKYTTLSVTPATKVRVKALKELLELETYDDVINFLLKDKEPLVKNLQIYMDMMKAVMVDKLREGTIDEDTYRELKETLDKMYRVIEEYVQP